MKAPEFQSAMGMWKPLDSSDCKLTVEKINSVRTLREPCSADPLPTVPTPSYSQCGVKRIHLDVRVYSQEDVRTLSLNDEKYAYPLQRGELDAAAPWME